MTLFLPLVLGLSWCLARTAHASCLMAIDGDPEAVADVQAALYSFAQDDVPCVAVRVLCSRDASDLVVDLNDQLGRSVQRRFSSAAGAAAFVISWSRRPLPQDGTSLTQLAPPPPAPLAPPRPAPLAPLPPPGPSALGTTPAVPSLVRSAAPGLTGVAAPASSVESPGGLAADGRHLELHLAYLPIGGNGGILEGVLVRHRGLWQYGAAVRAVATWPVVRHALDDGATESMWFLTEAEAVVRAQWTMDRLVARAEFATGAGVLGLWTDLSSSPYFQALGVRGGVRAMLLTPITSSLYLVAVAGTEVMLAAVTTSDNNALARERFQLWPHVAIGLSWAQ